MKTVLLFRYITNDLGTNWKIRGKRKWTEERISQTTWKVFLLVFLYPFYLRRKQEGDIKYKQG